VTTLPAALQSALAAEDEIVYGYGVVGAHVPTSLQPTVTAIWDSHRRRRDDLAELIRTAGDAPVAPAAAYALPFTVDSLATARRLATHLENGGAGAAWDLVAASPPSSGARTLAVGWLAASATDEVTLTGAAPALPGSP
jgi:hypothetical protein